MCLVHDANICDIKNILHGIALDVKVGLWSYIYCQNSMLHIVMSVKLQFHYDFLFT